MPSLRATESATAWESPVIIATRSPLGAARPTASADSGRISSPTASAPRAARLRRRPGPSGPRSAHPRHRGREVAGGLDAQLGEQARPADRRRPRPPLARAPAAGQRSNPDRAAGAIPRAARRTPRWPGPARAPSPPRPRPRAAAARPRRCRRPSPRRRAPARPSSACRSCRRSPRPARVPASSAIRSLHQQPVPRAERRRDRDRPAGSPGPSACGQAITSTVTVRTTAPSGSPRSHQTTRVTAPAASAT